MKSLKLLLVLAVLIAYLSISSIAAKTEDDYELIDALKDDDEGEPLPTFLRGTGRFLSEKRMTCDKTPRVCRAKGSPGRRCCKKKCVNHKTDKLNCGKCGHKCKFTESCCKGKCVNTSLDRKNCGGCHRKCKKGSHCAYGMCSYA